MSNLLEMIQMMDIIDLIDILLTSFFFYYAIKFVRERRAGKLALGVFVLVLLELASAAFELPVIGFLMQNLFQVGIIAMIILFQPELRSALEKIGGVQVGGIRGIINSGEGKQTEQLGQTVEGICSAICEMSLDKTGALIVFERSTKLGDYLRNGTVLNADASPRLIRNIFFNKSPLHDGALIIREGKLLAAGCLLPLTTNPDLDRDLGTRHRAAIGMSENSDAIVIVVSEETGIISMAKEGQIYRNYDYRRLYNELMLELSPARPLPGGKRRKQDNDSKGSDEPTA